MISFILGSMTVRVGVHQNEVTFPVICGIQGVHSGFFSMVKDIIRMILRTKSNLIAGEL